MNLLTKYELQHNLWKVLAVILLFAFLVSCSDVVDNGAKNSNLPGEISDDIALDSKTLQIYYPRNPEAIPSEDFINTWENYMYDKYKIDIELKYVEYNEPRISTLLGTPAGFDSHSLAESGKYNGLVYVNRLEILNRLVEEDLIIPVNNIIGELGLQAAFPEASLNQFTDEDKNIWAVPLSTKVFSRGRAYKGEWLLQSGFSIPATFEDFYKYAKHIAKNDPDGNGRADTFICRYKPELILSLFPDVMASFGCYTYAGEIISYNPHSGRYENIVFNENFQDAIGFIKLMVDERLLLDESTSEAAKLEPKYASVMGGGDASYEDTEYGYYLKGYNENFLVRQTPQVFSLAVLKDTEDASSLVSAYLDCAKANPESHMDFSCGMKDKSYFEHPEYYTYKTKNPDGNPVELIGLYIDPGSSHEYVKPRYKLDDENEVSEEAIRETSLAEDSFTASNEFNGTDLVYSLNFSDKKIEYAKKNGEILEITNEFFRKILSGNMAYEIAVKEYEDKLNLIE